MDRIMTNLARLHRHAVPALAAAGARVAAMVFAGFMGLAAFTPQAAQGLAADS